MLGERFRWRPCETAFDLFGRLSRPPRQSGGAAAELPHQVVLHAGEALVLPPSQWHAVENLEPTIAFGINEDASCSLREYARLTGPYTGFTL